MKLILLYLLSVNAAGFLIMLADKKKAIRHQWRIPERTLMSIAALGGGLGILCGMYAFRHKTRHLKFTLGVPLILAAQVICTVVMILTVF